MKRGDAKQTTVAEKMADAKELGLSRLRAVPREKREAVAEALIALADPSWWELRQKGSDVFLLILELRKNEARKIMGHPDAVQMAQVRKVVCRPSGTIVQGGGIGGFADPFQPGRGAGGRSPRQFPR